MPIDLTKPIPAGPAAGDVLAMLQNLQPNIVKPHVREFLTILFLEFGDTASAQALLGKIAPMIKSASQHLDEVRDFKANGTPGSAYIGFGLTRTGYELLGDGPVPADASFRAGMGANKDLHDPAVDTWDGYLQEPNRLHAIVLVGDMLQPDRDAALAQVRQVIATVPGVQVIGEQEGVAQHNDNQEGIEHFGYVDGRSQPLFLQDDIDRERDFTDGISAWNPAFPLEQVIVPDPAAPNPELHFGSYFIYRKLEQNVKLFKSSEQDFADNLGITDDERAGAMLVGRFEDGTPVTVQFDDGVESPVPNDFNYSSDIKGAKCPFLGHIRKTNPRGSGGFNQTEQQERRHLMARRGQTYGIRTDNPNDGLLDNKPEKDVGLLFMAFNTNIAQQFEFTQIVWANNPDFPEVPAGSAAPGIDPLIGQVPPNDQRPQMTAPQKWGDGTSMQTVAPVPQAVTMKGGAYFFMPSLAFLKGFVTSATAD